MDAFQYYRKLGGTVEKDTGGPKPSRPAPGGVQIKHSCLVGG